MMMKWLALIALVGCGDNSGPGIENPIRDQYGTWIEIQPEGRVCGNDTQYKFWANFSNTSDNLVVTKDPDSGVTDWGIYRSMFRTKNEKNFDMTCTSHRGRLNGLKYQARKQNMPVAIVLGGPTLDKLAALAAQP